LLSRLPHARKFTSSQRQLSRPVIPRLAPRPRSASSGCSDLRTCSQAIFVGPTIGTATPRAPSESHTTRLAQSSSIRSGRGWHALLCRRRGRPSRRYRPRRPHRHAQCSRQDRGRQSEISRALFGKRDGETRPTAAASRQAVLDTNLGRLPPRRHHRVREGQANRRPRSGALGAHLEGL